MIQLNVFDKYTAGVLRIMQFNQFEQIYTDYLVKIRELDLASKSRVIGGDLIQGELILPLFEKDYRISPEGIMDMQGNRPLHAVTVLLSQYLLLSPEQIPAEQANTGWVSFRDFRDAAPFVGAFRHNVEQKIINCFQGNLDSLGRACENLGGYIPQSGLSYDLIRVFRALPRIEVALLFNDMDDEFSAETKLLFPESVEYYLDMECLAIIGWLLADYLNLQAGAQEMTII